MTNYAQTKARIFQWVGIVLILAVLAGAYWYFRVYGSTLNQSQNDLVTNGLVGLWSFNGDDISGTTAYDRSVSGNNGTLTGGPTVTQGKIGQALSFDGTNDYVDAGGASSLEPGFPFSISLWVKFDTLTGNNIPMVSSADIGGNGQYAGMWLGTASTGSVLVALGNNAGCCDAAFRRTFATGSSVVTTGTWYHIVATVTDVNTATIHVNGSSQSVTASGSAVSSVYPANSRFRIGAVYDANVTADTFLDGTIDEVRLYNRAITAPEITSLYTQGGGTKANTSVSQPQGTGRLDSGLAGYWKLDDGSGTSATDSSTNGDTGTLINGPTWTTGQIGSAVSFDGVDDYIDTDNGSSMDNLTQLTHAMWIYPTSDNGFLIAKRNSGGGHDGFRLTSGTLQGWISNFVADSVARSTSSTTVSLNVWSHVAMTYSHAGDKKVRLYINGSEVAYSEQDTNPSGTDTDTGFDFYVGTSQLSGTPFTGLIDEVRIYNRMLSADEIAQIYRLGVAGNSTTVDTGLKGYWSFNGPDMSGTTAYDRSGAGNTGTLTNDPTRTIGKIGQALSFDGTNDYVTIPDSANFDIGSTSSFSAWFKLSSLPSVFAPIVYKFQAAAEDKRLTVDSTGKINYYLYNSFGGATLDSQETIATNTWYHATATYDGTTARLYVNGVLSNSKSASGDVADGTGTLDIGRYTNGSTYYFPGSIDEVRVYNRALSAAEIKGLYDVGADDKVNSAVSQPQGTGRLDSGLAAYFPLDENTGTTTTDASTNAATGTLTGGPTWTTGQINYAVDFDGTDDYVTVADADTLDIADSTNFTLSGWFNRDTFTTDDTILAKSNGQAAADTGYNVYIDDSTDKVTFVANDGTDQYKLESVSTFTATGWHHYSLVWDDSGSGQTKLYINGVSEAATVTGTFANVNSLANAVTFRLGAESDAGNPFDGKLDEARLYNRALSADEIAQLYRFTTPTGTDTGLKGYWSFNGQDMLSSTTAADRSGVGNTGTLTGGPTKAIGKLGQALDFDGSDDYVSVADNTALDAGDTADLTLSGWFYRDTFTTDDTVIAKRNGITAGDTGYIAYIDDATDQLIFEVSDGTDEYSLTSVATFTTVGWNHYAIVWDQDSAANSEIYVNGVVNNATDAGTIGNIGDLSNAVVLTSGAESDAGNPFDGKLDELRIYNRTFTDREIWSLYQSGGGLANACRSSSVTDADGNIYGTVNIGSQCWMKQNMRVGTRISAATTQTNNATTEKYCYSNSDANCTSNNPNQPDGGLYQWNEAMQYVTTAGAQGICPAGFHIPTDTEWYVLENHLKDTGQTCSASRSGAYDCSSAGTKLKPNGVSGFEGNLAGYAFSGSFFFRASVGYFWSSSESGASAWNRYLGSSVATVYRSALDKSLGFSVRCLQDSP